VPYAAAARPGPAEPFEPGERVFHQKFGPGTITAIDHDKLTVAFDHAGEKRVMQGFVDRA
jgi:DNA helicase-2/ATP-dependent DNA helicase PcrA